MAGTPRRNPELELGLDFSNTVEWRNGEKREDSLKTLDYLVTWSVKKGIVTREEAPRILTKAKQEHSEEKIIRQAIRLREAIYRTFTDVAHDRHPAEADLQEINRFLSEHGTSSGIVRNGEEYGWGWQTDEGAEGKIRWPIAKSAADLLTSNQLGRVRECANEEEGCGWVFLDETRSGTKIWCSSDGCGNRAKVRAWYQRHEKARA
jgi:predicted RNA-binding Zn ribbon-like protein